MIFRPSNRRWVRHMIVVAIAVSVTVLAGCGGGDAAGESNGSLTLDDDLPTTVPEGTELTIGDPQTQIALELSGQIDDLDFDVEWVNLSGGPQTQEAFRANTLDVGSVAEIPSIHAKWTGLDTKIVASKFRKDPQRHPIYRLGIAPKSDVDSLEDLRGKKIAYSPGQAQGALVLRVLDKAGLSQDNVELVELPSTEDTYVTALASHQVDVAPLGGTNVKRYENDYAEDGGRTLPHGIRDDPGHLYVIESSLEDPGKAAAIREYVRVWARAQRWIHENPQEWIDGYYVEDQGLSREDGEYLVETAGEPDIPDDWDSVIERHQATIDLLAKEQDEPRLDAEELYDRRYESVASEALKAGETK